MHGSPLRVPRLRTAPLPAGRPIRRDLRSACERALVRAARAQGAGTRQQVRAAARRFVRHHRRDTGYLGWVLRGVTASAALAVALLGLGAAPASANLAPYAALTGAANPLQSFDVGDHSTPAFGDLDGDGDLDVISGEKLGVFLYFRNTGSAIAPAFISVTGSGNPMNGMDAGDESRPALGDLYGDGRLDLVVGVANGTFLTYRNTGSATSPAFVELTGTSNPLDGFDVGDMSAPALVDLDGDGDLDLVAGELNGGFFYFRNTGTATAPAFVAVTGAGNPLNGQDVGSNSSPAFADLDGDGDLDLVVGDATGAFTVFENTGSATSPAFVARTGNANPLNGLGAAQRSAPALGDFDGDGDPDLVSGANLGGFAAFEHQGGRLVPRLGSANPLNGAIAGFDSAPSFGDLDGDGDRDLIAGASDGTFHYFRNTGSAATPAFVELTGAANPLNGKDVGDEAIPALGDLDADGDLDVVAGAFDGTFHYFRNTGNTTTPAFTELTGASNPLNGVDLGTRSAPWLVDLDADGDLDLVAGAGDGTLHYFLNTGTAAAPAFAEQTGVGNPLSGQDVGTQSVPALADIDGDGDRDLVVGEAGGGFVYYENTGTAASPAFVVRTGGANPLDGRTASGTAATPAFVDLDHDGDFDLVSGNSNGTFDTFENFVPQVVPASPLTGSANPLNGIDVGDLSAPALGDLDGDGDLDLVSGERDGTFAYLRNTGSATHPAFTQVTGASNPLDGVDVGLYSAPALGDLDGDGDLDLVVGEPGGTFFYYKNTGTATAPAFVQMTGAANPFDGLDVGAWSTPVLGDLDGDGDLDLVSGENSGTLLYFRNTGTRTNPAFVAVTGSANPFNGFDVGSYSTPALGDFDGDGDLDLVSSANDGYFYYFDNTGSATAPAFAPLTGSSNPLDGENAGAGAAPTAGDLDGDGDPDLVTGTVAGTFAVHYFPEPARSALLGAGIALLSLFDRARRRSPR